VTTWVCSHRQPCGYHTHTHNHIISGNKLQLASAMKYRHFKATYTWWSMCIGRICAYVDTAGRVVSSTKLAIHTASHLYSHFIFICCSLLINNVLIVDASHELCLCGVELWTVYKRLDGSG